MWKTRIEALLDGLDDDEQRAVAAAELRQLLQEAAPAVSGETGMVFGNTFTGPTAFQAGDYNKQDIRFGPQP
ncbi:hypothetical protein ACWGKK_36565 [Streptomyces chartreusis]